MLRHTPRFTRTNTLCPYTTLFRSAQGVGIMAAEQRIGAVAPLHQVGTEVAVQHVVAVAADDGLDAAAIGQVGVVAAGAGRAVVLAAEYGVGTGTATEQVGAEVAVDQVAAVTTEHGIVAGAGGDAVIAAVQRDVVGAVTGVDILDAVLAGERLGGVGAEGDVADRPGARVAVEVAHREGVVGSDRSRLQHAAVGVGHHRVVGVIGGGRQDRKSTRLNSSH